MNEDTAQARELLHRDAMERADACAREYTQFMKELLTKANCGVQHQGQLQSGQWVPISDLGFVKGRIDFVPLLSMDKS